MYQVLYRKWRPKTFDDVCGQPQVTETVKSQLKNGRISHAYLFTGSRGTGKTTCAKILAKAVNCLNLKDGNPCGECEICKGIDSGRILDVTEMDAASNNHVDDIKSLIDEVNYSPSEAKYRVYIVDEVHMLTKSAFNALLKTLEEPPAHVVFILATTEIHELPATIVSRCQRFDFHRIDMQIIADRLIYIANEEGSVLERDAALLIGALADGALRDALSILDRAMSIDKNVTADIVRKLAGIADREHLFAISDCVNQRNTNEVLGIVDKLYRESMNCLQLCKELISHYRSIMLIKTMKDPRSLVIMTDQEFERGSSIASNMSLEKITYAVSTLFTANEKILKGADSRIELELALVRLCSPELDMDYDAILSRLSSLEISLKNGNFSHNYTRSDDNSHVAEDLHDDAHLNNVTPSKPKVIERNIPSFDNDNIKRDTPVNDTATPPPVQPTSTNTKKLDFEEIKSKAVPFEKWNDVLAVMSRYSKAITSAFDGTAAYISGDYILIDSENEMPFLLLKQPLQRDKMRTAIRQVTGRVYKLGPYNQVKATQKEDPLNNFINKAKQQGIDVKTN